MPLTARFWDKAELARAWGWDTVLAEVLRTVRRVRVAESRPVRKTVLKARKAESKSVSTGKGTVSIGDSQCGQLS